MFVDIEQSPMRQREENGGKMAGRWESPIIKNIAVC